MVVLMTTMITMEITTTTTMVVPLQAKNTLHFLDQMFSTTPKSLIQEENHSSSTQLSQQLETDTSHQSNAIAHQEMVTMPKYSIKTATKDHTVQLL